MSKFLNFWYCQANFNSVHETYINAHVFNIMITKSGGHGGNYSWQTHSTDKGGSIVYLEFTFHETLAMIFGISI